MQQVACGAKEKFFGGPGGDFPPGRGDPYAEMREESASWYSATSDTLLIGSPRRGAPGRRRHPVVIFLNLCYLIIFMLWRLNNEENNDLYYNDMWS
jgi:hypothetical protein